MVAHVTVYDLEGKPHPKTLQNARDMVAQQGWTWKPGLDWKPSQSAPYAGAVKVDRNAPSIAQTILDGVSLNSKPIEAETFDDVPDAPVIDIFDAPPPVPAPEIASAPEASADDEDAPTEEGAEPKKRGRPRKIADPTVEE